MAFEAIRVSSFLVTLDTIALDVDKSREMKAVKTRDADFGEKESTFDPIPF